MIDLFLRTFFKATPGAEDDGMGKQVITPAYICHYCGATDIGSSEWYRDDGEVITVYGCLICGASGTKDDFKTGNSLGHCAYCGDETAVLCAKCSYAICPDCLAQDKPPLCLDCY
jgi:hypothetical protein